MYGRYDDSIFFNTTKDMTTGICNSWILVFFSWKKWLDFRLKIPCFVYSVIIFFGINGPIWINWTLKFEMCCSLFEIFPIVSIIWMFFIALYNNNNNNNNYLIGGPCETEIIAKLTDSPVPFFCKLLRIWSKIYWFVMLNDMKKQIFGLFKLPMILDFWKII